MSTILHISDLHFGRPYRPEVGDAVHCLARQNRPDLVICSGDIVQWAESEKAWRAARSFFDRFEPPILTLPGNHDVFRARPLKRLFSLLTPYIRHFGGEGFSHFTSPAGDFGVAGIWTPAPWSMDRGYISPASIDHARHYLAGLPDSTFRIVVQHQAAFPRFTNRGIPTCPWGTERALAAYDDLGVRLLLSGHNHFHHVEQSPLPSGANLIWAQSGTTTSNRVYRANPPVNSCNWISLSAGLVEIEPWFHDPVAGAFLPGESVHFRL